MDATIFIPRYFHRALAALGKRPWLRVRGQTDTQHYVHIVTAEVNAAAAGLNDDDREHLKRLFDVAEAKLFEAINACAMLLAHGPKVFRPTVAQCEAAAAIDIGLTLAEYAQPYPALVVELPAAFAAPRGYPRHVLTTYDPTQFLFNALVGNVAGGQMQDTFTLMTICGAARVIEEKLRTIAVDETPQNGLPGFHIPWRIAVNCNLLLTAYRARLLPTPQTAKLEKMTKRGSPAARARARLLLAGEFRCVEFEQEIKFHDEEGAVAAPGMPTGRHCRPHWRRGHWRRQPYGAGNALRRPVLIKPVLVRRDLFVGDDADTAVQISG